MAWIGGTLLRTLGALRVTWMRYARCRQPQITCARHVLVRMPRQQMQRSARERSNVGTRAAVARLEDRIAQVDDPLTSVRLNGVHPDRLTVLGSGTPAGMAVDSALARPFVATGGAVIDAVQALIPPRRISLRESDMPNNLTPLNFSKALHHLRLRATH